ncbi:MAG: endonuclease III [Bacteroidales bacterium]|jgi:endonuclease-3|nr:endonuclease III [Bacteroidales bacterium]
MKQKMTESRKKILEWFDKYGPEPKSELKFKSPFELIVAVILSAQCTDKRVNMTTPALLAKYPDAESLAKATEKDIFKYIKSISFPNSKAAHLLGMAKMLVKDFGGKVPEEIEQMEKLPGVGRKTANVVASICFNKPVIAVDTHVFRVAHRIGFSKGATPLEVEEDLEKMIPVDKRAKAHHWLILHGRYVCKSAKPMCDECPISKWCPKLLENSKL